MSRFASQSGQRPLWQRLIAPMLFASLGLHGLFLLIPTASSDEVAIPPPDPETDSITITRVPPSAPPEGALAPAQNDAIAPPQAVSVAPAPTAAQQRPVQATRAAGRPQSTRPAPQPAREPLPSLDENPAPAVQSPNPDPPTPDPPSMVITPLPAEEARALLASLQTSDRIANTIADLRAYLDRRYSYQPESTTRDALSANQQQWIADVKQSLNRPDLEPEIYRPDIDVIHRQRVCFSPEPWSTPVLGFVLTPSGRLAEDPVVLRSTGYGILDSQAIEALKRADLSAPEATTAYTIQAAVEVDYGRYDCLQVKPAAAS